MASRFQQQSLTRKFIYFGLVLVLFTVSLLHRKLVINAQANELRLREEQQGEVELTGSAIRLTLSGVRGIVICALWQAAIDKQKKHEWNELETIVRSLTKLQPHFISPWLFQSWNLAFNVSVECDVPRDKYFYISRGLELLAEGERRNKGNEDPDPEKRSPANPEMRFHLGFTYQLKLGQGDEQQTLKCLLDMSSIDPVKRDKGRFMQAGGGGEEVNLEEFQKFCESHPRLVRRLREKLSYERPSSIIRFLDENKDLPSRFEKPTDQPETPLRDPVERFPVLPPQLHDSWPNPNSRDFEPMDVDVATICRAWYGYAQIPLPPINPDPGIDNPAERRHFKLKELDQSRLKYRLPKMSQYIFRTYPARAQAYRAEYLQQEGWFDDSGWLIRDWFYKIEDGAKVDDYVVVGRGAKYHSGDAWQEAYRMYEEYGTKNGLLLKPDFEEQLRKEASERGLTTRVIEEFVAKKREGVAHYRQLTNFGDFFHQSDKERLPETVAARKRFHEAVQLRRDVRAVGVYEQALELWLDVLLKNPNFRQIGTIQEESYEMQIRYQRRVQFQNKERLERFFVTFAQITHAMGAASNPGGFPERFVYFVDKQEAWLRDQALPLRDTAGTYDWLHVYEGKQPQLVQTVTAGLWILTYQSGQHELARAPLVSFADVLLKAKPDRRVLTPQQERRWLTLLAPRQTPPGREWVPLIPDSAITVTRDRMDIGRPRPQPQPEAAQ